MIIINLIITTLWRFRLLSGISMMISFVIDIIMVLLLIESMGIFFTQLLYFVNLTLIFI